MATTALAKIEKRPGDKLPPGPTPLGEYSNDQVAWDFPPPYFVPMSAEVKRLRASSKAHGEPIVLNEMCGNWDLGDLPTWLLILAMSLLGLLIAVTAYLLPHGQDAFVPSIKVY